MNEKNYFAVDLGATSGRTILGTMRDGKLEMREVTRFRNHIIENGDHSYWNLLALYREIIGGLKRVAADGIHIESIGIDTWGVDFAFFGKDGELLRPPYSYRDRKNTQGAPQRYFKKVPAEKVYSITGIQVLDFNSLYQLNSLKEDGCSALESADKILFLPDALSYMLTGNMVTEYTIASTSNFLNPRTKQLEQELLNPIGISVDQFAPIVMPGTQIGTLSPNVQRLTGLGAVPVIAVAGHDTASAVAAVPAAGQEYAYLSSGTWSLMGIETDEPIITETSREWNFTNEGGLGGKTRFLKNICGMWLLERCCQEWGNNDYACLITSAKEVKPFRSIINPDDPSFANPISMVQAIIQYCEDTNQPVPQSKGEFSRCIFDSLALRYRMVMNKLQDMSPFNIKRLHVIGGGSRNDMLNQLTANATQKLVVAGPSECTAMGNLLVQIKTKDPEHFDRRSIVVRSVDTKMFCPGDKELWDEGYVKFLRILENYEHKIVS